MTIVANIFKVMAMLGLAGFTIVYCISPIDIVPGPFEDWMLVALNVWADKRAIESMV